MLFSKGGLFLVSVTMLPLCMNTLSLEGAITSANLRFCRVGDKLLYVKGQTLMTEHIGEHSTLFVF